jgi:hypothetical protein
MDSTTPALRRCASGFVVYCLPTETVKQSMARGTVWRAAHAEQKVTHSDSIGHAATVAKMCGLSRVRSSATIAAMHH